MARRRAAGIGFMILWLTFWLAAILVAIWSMGSAALGGEPAAAVFLAVWLVAAGFGLVSGGRRLRGLLLGEAPRPRANPNHRWDDGVAPTETRPPPPPDARR